MRICFTFVMIGLLLLTSQCFASDTEGCMECHRLFLVSTGQGGKGKHLYLDDKSLELSKHGTMHCSDCHTDAVQVPHPSTPETVSCLERCHVEEEEDERKNHTEKYYAYQQDVHFINKYTCVECHTDFSSMSRQNASLLCLQCHRDGKSGDKGISFSTPVHGKLIGEGAAVVCVDCHSSHVTEMENALERSAMANCYRGFQCHGDWITEKVYLGSHGKESENGTFIRIVQWIFQIICISFIILGSIIVIKRQGEDFER